MNDQSKNGLIKEFLTRVEEKLPQWLKDKPDELKEVKEELEEHVLDKATELSESGEPNLGSIRQAIIEMGDPKSIAKEYKKRGTPKYFISEELFPIYLVALQGLLIVVLIINIIVHAVGIVSAIVTALLIPSTWGNIWVAIFQFPVWLILGAAVVFAILTLIFVWMSMEGYLPEDWEMDPETLNHWPFKEGIFAARDDYYAKKKPASWTKTVEVTAKDVTVTAEAPNYVEVPTPKEEPVKFVDVGSKIFSGIANLVFGYLFLFQPILLLNPLFHPLFLFGLRFFGIIVLLWGVVNLSRGILGNNHPTAHQVMVVFTMILDICVIPLYVILFLNPNIIPFILFNLAPPMIIVTSIPAVASAFGVWIYWLHYVIMGLVIFGSIVGALMNIWQIVKIERAAKILRKRKADYYVQ